MLHQIEHSNFTSTPIVVNHLDDELKCLLCFVLRTIFYYIIRFLFCLIYFIYLIKKVYFFYFQLFYKHTTNIWNKKIGGEKRIWTSDLFVRMVMTKTITIPIFQCTRNALPNWAISPFDWFVVWRYKYWLLKLLHFYP